MERDPGPPAEKKKRSEKLSLLLFDDGKSQTWMASLQRVRPVIMRMVLLRRFQIVFIMTIVLCGWMIGRNEGFCTTRKQQSLNFRQLNTLFLNPNKLNAPPNDDEIIDAEIVGRPSTWRRDEAVEKGEVAKESKLQMLKNIAIRGVSSIKNVFSKVTSSNSIKGEEVIVGSNRIGESDFSAAASSSVNNKPLSTRDFEELDTLLGSRNPLFNPLGNMMRGFINIALKDVQRNAAMTGDDYGAGDRGGSMLANMLQVLSGTGLSNDLVVRDAQRKASIFILSDIVCRDMLSDGRIINDADLMNELETSAPLSFSSSTVFLNGNIQKQISLDYHLSSAANSFNFVTVQLTVTVVGDKSRIDDLVVIPRNSGLEARRLILR